jgi:hypothetical protein
VAQKTSLKWNGDGTAAAAARVTAYLGQEIPVELIGDNLRGQTESTARVTYDSERLEFRRAADGQVTAMLGAGRLEVHLVHPGLAENSTKVLGTLFFQAKAGGSAMIEVRGAGVTWARKQVLVQ